MAAELGYEALALTDHDGVSGSLEFAHAAKLFGIRAITGAELTLEGGAHVTLLVETARGYTNLCRLLTAAHAGTRPDTVSRAGFSTAYRAPIPPSLPLDTLLEHTEGLVCLSGCARHGLAVRNPNAAARVAQAFGRDSFFVELQRPYERGDARRNARLRELAETLGVRTVATGDVHAHHATRIALQDVLVAVRHNTSLEGCEPERRGNHEAVLRPPAEAAERFPDDRDAVARTTELAQRLRFDLTEELGYRYPDFSDGDVPADVQLARICNHAFDERYSGLNGHKKRARERLDEELALIREIGLSGFFLLHHEVLELARDVAREVRGTDSPRSVLPPGRGRGSSVGSIVCYLTGLSHVDPVASGLSLGRFLNRELAAVPDIDLDFPRDIRERLIVRVIERYGSEHTALVCSFATYRARGAIRDVGKALGLPYAELERLARYSDGWNAAPRRRGGRPAPRREAEGALAALARLRRALPRDRRPAPPHLPAPRRHGHLVAAARRPRPRAARRHGRPPDLPVGQGLLRRRRLPQDRPARPRHALRRRGLRRADRPPARRADRPLAHPARRPGGLRRDPPGRHRRRLPDREPRADADAPAHPPREPRRPDDRGRARPARADPGRRRPPVHRPPRGAPPTTRRSCRRSTTRRSPSRSATRSASSSSRTRCSPSRWRSPASPSARPRRSAAR